MTDRHVLEAQGLRILQDVTPTRAWRASAVRAKNLICSCNYGLLLSQKGEGVKCFDQSWASDLKCGNCQNAKL